MRDCPPGTDLICVFSFSCVLYGCLGTTGVGLREWVYYARSQQEFMSKVNEALRKVPRFPIEIDLWRDPEWKRYEEFRSRM
jgi:hypothetical protein